MPRPPVVEGEKCIRKNFPITPNQVKWLDAQSKLRTKAERLKGGKSISEAELVRKALNFLINHENVIDLYVFYEENHGQTNVARGLS